MIPLNRSHVKQNYEVWQSKMLQQHTKICGLIENFHTEWSRKFWLSCNPVYADEGKIIYPTWALLYEDSTTAGSYIVHYSYGWSKTQTSKKRTHRKKYTCPFPSQNKILIGNPIGSTNTQVSEKKVYVTEHSIFTIFSTFFFFFFCIISLEVGNSPVEVVQFPLHVSASTFSSNIQWFTTTFIGVPTSEISVNTGIQTDCSRTNTWCT